MLHVLSQLKNIFIMLVEPFAIKNNSQILFENRAYLDEPFWAQGCQIFLGATYQNEKKYSK
jgi:hypothetical protein